MARVLGDTLNMTVRKVHVGGYEVVTTDTDKVGGRTFLLVHGIGMGITYFAELSQALESHGRVVARRGAWCRTFSLKAPRAGPGRGSHVKTGPRWLIKKRRSMIEHAMEDTLAQIQAHTWRSAATTIPAVPMAGVEEVTALPGSLNLLVLVHKRTLSAYAPKR